MKKIKLYILYQIRKIIIWLGIKFDINFIITGYKQIGILDTSDKGEEYFIQNTLSEYLHGQKLVFFDIGANIGSYSLSLRKKFSPPNEIYAFEPNYKIFKNLKDNLSEKNVNCINMGLGEMTGNKKIYCYSKPEYSTLSTVNKGALQNLYKIDDSIEEIDFILTTVDEFCKNNNIDHIDLLKIDVEGNELNVLKGAKEKLNSKKISLIQFEFNDFNVYARTFLKDFYEILPNYDFFRIKKNGLVPLGGYDTINEIFKFQNIIAVSKEIKK